MMVDVNGEIVGIFLGIGCIAIFIVGSSSGVTGDVALVLFGLLCFGVICLVASLLSLIGPKSHKGYNSGGRQH
jgi:hypothetical protein